MLYNSVDSAFEPFILDGTVELPEVSVAYFADEDVLMRKWTPPNSKHA